MNKIKSLSALILIVFAQVNIFSNNILAIKIAQEIGFKKENKFSANFFKQAISRIGSHAKLNLKVFFAKKIVQNLVILNPILTLTFEFDFLSNSEFSRFRLMWFGCCK
ncbi:MAG: hypothetical protein SFV53_03805 [Rickettsiales bacterium]|nr:hypothetical protein [Rickettsiales bacterium]